MAEADHISRKLSYGKAEIHAKIALCDGYLRGRSAGSYLSISTPIGYP